MKYITFKNNKYIRKIRFNNFEKDINDLPNCNEHITKLQEIIIIISLPNSTFHKEFYSINGFTYRQFFYNIYETVCRAIRADRIKYPLSYHNKLSIQEIVDNYSLRCTRETSDIKMNGKIFHVTPDL